MFVGNGIECAHTRYSRLTPLNCLIVGYRPFQIYKHAGETIIQKRRNKTYWDTKDLLVFKDVLAVFKHALCQVRLESVSDI